MLEQTLLGDSKRSWQRIGFVSCRTTNQLTLVRGIRSLDGIRGDLVQVRYGRGGRIPVCCGRGQGAASSGWWWGRFHCGRLDLCRRRGTGAKGSRGRRGIAGVGAANRGWRGFYFDDHRIGSLRPGCGFWLRQLRWSCGFGGQGVARLSRFRGIHACR